MSATHHILAIEPWFGGSHRSFLESWKARTAHALSILGRPGRTWKWRMSAGAWELARGLHDAPAPDLIFASDYLHLPAFFGHAPPRFAHVPALMYFHENQVTYPSPDDAPKNDRDHQYGIMNIMSCLRADGLAFNSQHHLEEFTAGAVQLLACLPKPNPRVELEAALARARVIAPGIELGSISAGLGAPREAPLRIAFNHRWEFDKDPLEFLHAVREVHASGAAVQLVLLGETYERLPAGCARELEALDSLVVHGGYAESRTEYAALLGTCDVVISTALHEFFGISVLEAMAAGATPLLPNRLSYPGLLEESERATAIYADPGDLRTRLARLARDPALTRLPAERMRWRAVAERWSAERSAAELDKFCAELVRRAH